MKIRVLLTGLLLAVSAASASAAGPYIGAAGGASFFHDSDMRAPDTPTMTAGYDTGPGFSLSTGARFDGGRIEGEYGYRTSDLDKLSASGESISVTGVDITVKSFMINGYFDFNAESAVTPFVGGGFGLMNYELKGNGGSEDASTFGYQLIAGVGFNLNKTVTLDASYRFQGAASDFEKDGKKISYMSSSLFGGVRLNF